MKLEIKCQECGETCIEEPDVGDLTWHKCPNREDPVNGYKHSVFIVEIKGDTIKVY